MGLLLLLLSATPACASEDPDGAEELVVTGTRTPHPANAGSVATLVVTAEEIEASGAETVADLLEQVPGVAIVRGFNGATVQLQGLGAEHVLILVDGQRMGGRLAGGLDLSRFNVDDIERIEVVKGPAAALYGSEAMGGVINIITRAPERPWEGHLGGRYGSRNTYDAAASGGLRTDKGSLRLTAGVHGRDGFDLEERDLATDGNAVEQLNGTLRGQWKPTSNLSLDGRLTAQRADVTGIDSNAAGAVLDRRNLVEELRAQGRTRWTASDRVRLSARGSLAFYKDQYLVDQRGADDLDVYEVTEETLTEAGLQADWLGEGHIVSTGLDGLAEWRRSPRLGDVDGERQRLAWFAQDQWTFGGADQFELVPGIRLDADTQFGFHPTPKIAASWTLHDRLVLRASGGLGYRAPAFNELLLRFANPSANYEVEGNPDLRPETSRNLTVGTSWQARKVVRVELSAFYNWLDDLIGVQTLEEASPSGPARYAYVNIEEAWTRGVDLDVELELADGVSFGLGGLLTDTRDLEEDRAIEGRALLRGTSLLDLSREAWGTSLRLQSNVTGPRPFYEDTDGDGVESTEMSKTAVLVDARFAQQITPWLSVSAGVDNLLDVGDADTFQVPPRLVYAGLDLRPHRPDDAQRGDRP